MSMPARSFRQRPRPRPARGFTLIELFIAVLIVSILTAVALPSYQRYTARGNRAAAKAFLSDLGQRQESFFADRKHYSTTFGSLGFVDATSGAALGTDAFVDQKGALSSTLLLTRPQGSVADVTVYKVSLVNNPTGGATSVRLCAGLSSVPTPAAFGTAWAAVAVPQAPQDSRDATCGTLCLNSTGRQGASGMIVNGVNKGDNWQTCWRG